MAVNPYRRERTTKSSQRKQHLGLSCKGELTLILQRRVREFQMEPRVKQRPWPGNVTPTQGKWRDKFDWHEKATAEVRENANEDGWGQMDGALYFNILNNTLSGSKAKGTKGYIVKATFPSLPQLCCFPSQRQPKLAVSFMCPYRGILCIHK